AFQPRRCQLSTSDRVRLPQDGEPLSGDLSDDPDRQPRAGERMPPDDPGWQPELYAHRPHLVLEQRAQRLHELELTAVWQAADVVVTLDVGCTLTATGFHHVGIERALHEKLDLTGLPDDLTSSGLEGPDELPADDLALFLWVRRSGQRGEELHRSVDNLEVDARRGDVVSFDLLGFPLPQQTMIDKDTGQLATDRELHQSRRHRGVDTTRKAADDVLAADLLLDGLHWLVDDIGRSPIRRTSGDGVQEMLQHPLAMLGVQYLRVPLDAGKAPVDILECGNGGSR